MKREDYIQMLSHAAISDNGVLRTFEYPEHAWRARAHLYRARQYLREKKGNYSYDALCFRIRGETLYIVKTERISKEDDGIDQVEAWELGLGDLYELPTWPSAKGRRG